MSHVFEVVVEASKADLFEARIVDHPACVRLKRRSSRLDASYTVFEIETPGVRYAFYLGVLAERSVGPLNRMSFHWGH